MKYTVEAMHIKHGFHTYEKYVTDSLDRAKKKAQAWIAHGWMRIRIIKQIGTYKVLVEI